MQKRTITTLTTLVVMSALISIGAGYAEVPAPCDQGLIHETAEMFGAIQGKVQFQKRSTVVPMSGGEFTTESLCTSEKCPKSNPYWAVVIVQGDTVYELNQAFAFGKSRAPEYVQIENVLIRPGVEVYMEGTVETISPTYGIIGDVKVVTLVDGEKVLMRRNPGGTEYVWNLDAAGWSCQSYDTDGSVSARIWYGRRTNQEPEAFHIRVTAKSFENSVVVEHVIDLGNVQVRDVAGKLSFESKAPQADASLAIHKNPSQLRNFPATLRVSNVAKSNEDIFPFEGDVSMFCNPSMFPEGTGVGSIHTD